MSDEETPTPGGETDGRAPTAGSAGSQRRGGGFEIPRAVLIAVIALYGFVVLRTAWLCDDAYITFRTIDNLFAGQGLTYNVGERVQAFTHPLWLVLLSAAFSLTHEFWNTAIVVSLALSLATVALFAFGVARSRAAALVGVLALTLSKAYVDYSTSGLENPLSNLLLAAFLFVYFRAQQGSRRLLLLSLIASLAAVNRPDALLLFIPALLWELWENRSWKAVRVALLGCLPLFLWEAFSLFYYGFLFPNTAYAKLNTGLSLYELASQGWRYVGSSIHADPITPLVILAGVGAALVAKSRRALPISIGLIPYLAYVVSIGGDFMRGRFFTMPLLASVALLSTLRFGRVTTFVPAVALLGLVGLTTPQPTVISTSTYGTDEAVGSKAARSVDRRGVVDERAFYYQATGLLARGRGQHMPHFPWAREGAAAATADPPVATRLTIGFFGFYAGRRVHVVDTLALAEPLLARLTPELRLDWRVGHFPRHVPEGYLETLISGENKIANRDLAQYYDRLRYVIAGPLWAPRRLLEIVKLNAGAYDSLLGRYEESRFAHMSYNDLPPADARGTTLAAAGSSSAPPGGVKIAIGRLAHARRVALVMDVRQAYWVVFRQSGSLVARHIVEDVPGSEGLQEHVVELAGGVARKGYDEIAVVPASRRAQRKDAARFLFKRPRLLE